MDVDSLDQGSSLNRYRISLQVSVVLENRAISSVNFRPLVVLF